MSNAAVVELLLQMGCAAFNAFKWAAGPLSSATKLLWLWLHPVEYL